MKELTLPLGGTRDAIAMLKDLLKEIRALREEVETVSKNCVSAGILLENEGDFGKK